MNPPLVEDPPLIPVPPELLSLPELPVPPGPPLVLVPLSVSPPLFDVDIVVAVVLMPVVPLLSPEQPATDNAMVVSALRTSCRFMMFSCPLWFW
ncbi:MAG: hypothetical protein D6705_13385 [Deltaproteobacteria bacterium]|nr:MAG: hypothetical protein D6705_13385 [Deltaproteobacteria bacterium]